MKPSESVYERASEFFLKLQDPAVSPDEIEAVFEWVAATQEHTAAFDQVQKFWHGGDSNSPPKRATVVTLDVVQARTHRRRTTSWAGALCAVSLALATAVVWLSPNSTPSRYATLVGENRTIVLEDGSEVVLGGASSISVELQSRNRHIVLMDGEALFKVAKDARRPFVVSSGGGSTRAVGTQFDVRRGANGVTVAVVEGIVSVQTDNRSTSVSLVRGSEVTYSATAGVDRPHNVDIEQLAGWRHGQFTFIDQPLNAVVADLNRYSRRIILLDQESLKRIRITGSVSVDGIEEWLRALQQTAPIEIHFSSKEIALKATSPSS